MKTNFTLFEEATRYEDALNQFVVSASFSSPLLFSDRTPLGEYYDHFGVRREIGEGEIPNPVTLALCFGDFGR